MNSAIPFDKIRVQMCVATEERLYDAYAALCCLMTNVKFCRINLLLNFPAPSESAEARLTTLRAIAASTTNSLIVSKYAVSKSKANMIADDLRAILKEQVVCKRSNEDEYVLNVDDDWLIPKQTLQLLYDATKHHTQTDLFIYGMFDVINRRNHADWDTKVVKLKDVVDFVAKNGLRCLHNHMQEPMTSGGEVPLVLNAPGHSTGTYMFKLSSYLNNKTDLEHELSSWPKGLRGYDITFCTAFPSVQLLWGANSYHTDPTGKSVDGKLWKQGALRPDMRVDGTETYKEA